MLEILLIQMPDLFFGHCLSSVIWMRVWMLKPRLKLVKVQFEYPSGYPSRYEGRYPKLYPRERSNKKPYILMTSNATLPWNLEAVQVHLQHRRVCPNSHLDSHKVAYIDLK